MALYPGQTRGRPAPAMLRRTRHFQVGQTWRRRKHDICSAPVAVSKRSLRSGMMLTPRKAMDGDVVLQMERSNRRARKALRQTISSLVN